MTHKFQQPGFAKPTFTKQFRKATGKNPEREDYKKHPEYIDRFVSELSKIEFPAENIPSELHEWVMTALMDCAFPALHLPIATYGKIIHQTPEKWGFGVLEKAVDIVFNAKPNGFQLSSLLDTLKDHEGKMKSIGKIRQQFEDIKEPIRQAVIDKLILEEAPSIITA